jgi:hypothetical protein
VRLASRSSPPPSVMRIDREQLDACGLAETCACGLERQLCLGLLCQSEPSLSHRYQQHLVLGISKVTSNA